MVTVLVACALCHQDAAAYMQASFPDSCKPAVCSCMLSITDTPPPPPYSPAMVKPVDTLPPKLPEGVSMDSPLAHLPLTRENMRTNLDKVLRQMHSYGLTDQHDYEHLTSQLYTPNAEFHYPIAKLNGRYEIVQFWNLFLLVRAFERADVHSMKVDVAWDPEKLQALVQVGL